MGTLSGGCGGVGGRPKSSVLSRRAPLPAFVFASRPPACATTVPQTNPRPRRAPPPNSRGWKPADSAAYLLRLPALRPATGCQCDSNHATSRNTGASSASAAPSRRRWSSAVSIMSPQCARTTQAGRNGPLAYWRLRRTNGICEAASGCWLSGHGCFRCAERTKQEKPTIFS